MLTTVGTGRTLFGSSVPAAVPASETPAHQQKAATYISGLQNSLSVSIEFPKKRSYNTSTETKNKCQSGFIIPGGSMVIYYLIRLFFLFSAIFVLPLGKHHVIIFVNCSMF